MGLRPAPMGIPAPGPEEQKRPPGSAGRPIDRPRLWGSLGPIARIELSEDHRRPRLFLVFQGLRDPWQAGFVRTNPMLAETKTRRCIRSKPPRRSHANPQSSAHLQLPSSCLAGVAGPATWRAYGLPGWEADPQAQGNKSGPAGSARQTRDRPPAPGGPGTHWGIQQPEGSRRPRSNSRHCRASDPGRPWKSCQTRNRLRFWFC